MSERERELLYWRITCAAIAASPAVAYLVARQADPPWFAPPEYIGALLVSLPLPILVEVVVLLVRGRLPRVWIDQPRVDVEHRAPGDVDEAVRVMVERLGEFGFQVQVERRGDAVEVAYVRPKASGGVHAMADHAFAGAARVEPSPYGSRVDAELILLDTLILESGELAMLDGLAAYVTGRAQSVDVATLPYTSLCAIGLSWVATGLAAAAGFGVGPGWRWAAGAAAASASMAIVMLFVGAAKGGALLGRRVLLAAIALAAIPWLAWAVAALVKGEG